MNIYFFRKFDKKTFNKDMKKPLFYKAFNEYIKEKNIKLKEDFRDIRILKSKKGKPFFNISKIHFNISHSEHVWVCVFSENEIGIDLQFKKSIDYLRFSKKYFTEEEMDFLVKLEDEEEIKESFYKLWTGKEAIVKLKGESIFCDVKKYNLVENGKLKKCIKSENIVISEVFIGENFQCSLAYDAHKIKNSENEIIRTFELEWNRKMD